MTDKADEATLTADELHRILSYDPTTGLFSWRARPSQAVKVGDEAGAKTIYGYTVIGYRGSVHMAHRLAHLAMTGAWPSQEIDHRDGDRSNNSWDNLRLCTRAENQQNRREGRGSSRYLGVSRRLEDAPKPWVARIMKDGKAINLGRFTCETAAYAAYSKAKRKYHTFAAGDAHHG